ncbi:MAG: hypothetical protein A2V85_11365 [Chloroflexi bacterium RBG_16_72_14]|nr:MAG: hypothetical protein A2V85_11365 [Chloroflexi bacterium RBG_16_72_14]
MHRPGVSLLLRRLARDGFLALSAAFLLLRLLQVKPWDQSVDAYAYWATRDGGLYDGVGAGVLGAYLYPPAFAQLLAPLTLLPWPLFVTLWTALNLAVLWWLLGRWSLPALLFLPIPFEIVSGNVHLLYAAAIVIAIRASAAWGPVAWVLPLITKLTPGVGLLWHAARRQWGPIAVALGSAAAIVAVSYVLDPAAWRTWLDVVGISSSTPSTVGWFLPAPLLVRLPVAAILAVVAGLTGRAWLVPIAVMLALPVVWLNSLAILAACVPLWRPGVVRDTATDEPGVGAATLRAAGP